jgi:hypothetical protein
LTAGLLDGGQVRFAGLSGGGTHADENSGNPRHRLGDALGKGQAPRVYPFFHQLGEARLEEGTLAAVQTLDLAGIVIDPHHGVAEVRQSGALNEPDMARSNYC